MQHLVEESKLKEEAPDLSADSASEKPCVLEDVEIEELAVDGICGIY